MGGVRISVKGVHSCIYTLKMVFGSNKMVKNGIFSLFSFLPTLPGKKREKKTRCKCIPCVLLPASVITDFYLHKNIEIWACYKYAPKCEREKTIKL